MSDLSGQGEIGGGGVVVGVAVMLMGGGWLVMRGSENKLNKF